MKMESTSQLNQPKAQLTLSFLTFLSLSLESKNKEELERGSGDWQGKWKMKWKQAIQGHYLIKSKSSSSQSMVMVSS